MRRRTTGEESRPPTDQELVDAIAAAGLAHRWAEHTPEERERLDQLLAGYGLDHVDLARARMRLTLAAARGTLPTDREAPR